MKWTITYRTSKNAKTEWTKDVDARTERAAFFSFATSHYGWPVIAIAPAKPTVEVES